MRSARIKENPIFIVDENTIKEKTESKRYQSIHDDTTSSFSTNEDKPSATENQLLFYKRLQSFVNELNDLTIKKQSLLKKWTNEFKNDPTQLTSNQEMFELLMTILKTQHENVEKERNEILELKRYQLILFLTK